MLYLMRSRIIEANLVKLNEQFQLSYLEDLIIKKTTEKEKSTLKDKQIDFYFREYERLQKELETASKNSHLPETSSAKPELNDLLVQIRLLS